MTFRRSFCTSTMSADSIAMSVPAPMAMPTSAVASAGESLMPSPTMATTMPRDCSCLTLSTFCVGRTSANTCVIPTLAATAAAVYLLSPVTIHTSTPLRWSSLTVQNASFLTESWITAMPRTSRSSATKITVLHSSSSSRSSCRTSTGTSTLSWASSFWLPASTRLPSTLHTTPMPVTLSNSVGVTIRALIIRALSTIDFAIGCSLLDSADASRW
mmetsp:Transcript_3329/g.11702  ORF Transcript_3329/g.11702 Transcript_3329/m.11702 type:complete len:215 (-) Transcript_3329:1545-2189(-)